MKQPEQETKELKVIQSSREIIEHKLLASLDDSEKVAIVCDRKMLDLLITGLQALLWSTNPAAGELAKDLERLREEAFRK